MSVLRNIKLLGLFNFFSDFRLYGPVLVIYFADVSGSYAKATSVLAATMLASALLEIPTGVLSDRLGRRRTAIVGAIASAVAVSLYAVAPGYLVLIFGAVFEGVARSFYSGNNDALLYDSLAQEGREGEFHRHSGRVGSMFQLALATSAVAGGLVGLISLRLVVALSIVPQMLCFLIALRFVEPRVHGPIESNAFRHFRAAFTSMRKNPQLRRMVVASSLSQGVGETAFQMQPAFVSGLWPIWAVGFMRTGNNGLSFLSYWFSGRAIDRLGASKTLLFGQIWSNVMNIVAVAKPTVVSPGLIAAESLTHGSSIVSQSTLMHAEFTDRERATMGSIASFFGSIAFAVFAMIAGVVADKWGLRYTLIFCQAVGFLTLPIYWSVHLRHRR